jgi:hypothetical protein
MDVLDFPTTCRHHQVDLAGITFDLCPLTGAVEWLVGGEPADPLVVMARLFGQFDLVASMPGVRSPAGTVLAYRPNNRRGRALLSALPTGQWMQATPELWIGADGVLLLLAPINPTLTESLMRGP